MTHIFGSWKLDPEKLTLLNSLTGERIFFFDKKLMGDASTARGQFRLEYQFADLWLPVVVEIGSDTTGGPSVPRLQIDYGKQIEEWRDKVKFEERYPPYGAWRRIDDCVTDALACWPSLFAESDKTSRQFSVLGGWLNGEWRPELRRRIAHLSQTTKSHRDESVDESIGSEIVAIDSRPPTPFRYHPHPEEIDRTGHSSGHAASIAIDDEILLSGLSALPRIGRVRSSIHEPCTFTLPSELPLSGLKGRASYLASADMKRVLFPSSAALGETHKHSRGDAECLIYADQDVVVEILARSAGGIGWDIQTAVGGFGRRNADGAPQLIKIANSNTPNRSLCSRIQWAVLDGWLQWPGSSAMHRNSIGRIKLHESRFVTLLDGFRGGVFLGVDAMVHAELG